MLCTSLSYEKINGIDNISTKVQGVKELNIDNLMVNADHIGNFKIYIKADVKNLDQDKGRNDLYFTIIDNKTGQKSQKDSVFISNWILLSCLILNHLRDNI